jgi:hypothetical protein
LALLGIVSQAQRLVNQERDRERGLYFLKKVKKMDNMLFITIIWK